MNTRLKRPLLAVAISGALLAGGSAFAAPAFAGTPVSSIGAVLADEPTRTASPSTPAPTPTDTVSPTPTSTDTVSPAPTDTTTPTPEPTDTTSPAPTPTATTTAPAGDVTAPTGSLKLNLSSIWIGQKVSLTQVGVADETSGPNDITRVVTWGDGTSSTLTADPAPVVKQYTKAGTFKVTLKLTDAAGNSTLAYGSVAVTVPGHVAFSTTSVWPGQKFDIKVSAVPAGTTKISLDWGDGYVSVVKGQNFSVRGYYYHYHGKNNNALVRGAIPVRIVYTNKNGATSWIPAGKVNVRTDSWKPTVKVTKPAKSNQASSWKTLSGTVSDKGAGAPYAYVWLTRTTSNAVYCFTPKMKWARVYSEAEYDKVCVGVAVKVSNGKWSLKVGGVQKGTLYVDARAWDWADNASSWSSLKVNITR